jgi:hypothetical protein
LFSPSVILIAGDGGGIGYEKLSKLFSSGKSDLSSPTSSHIANIGAAIDIDDEHHYIKNMRDCSVRMESILLDVNEK